MNYQFIKMLSQNIELLIEENWSKLENLPDNKRGNKSFSIQIEIRKNGFSVGLIVTAEDRDDWDCEMTKPLPPIPNAAWEEMNL